MLALLGGVAGAQSQQLSGPLVSTGSDVTAFDVGPAGRRALYLADQDTRTVFELYSVPLDLSSPPVKLSGTMPFTGDVTRFETGSRRRIVYRADPSIDESFELFSVPSDGGKPPLRLTPPMPTGRTVGGFQVTPDGRVVFSSNQLASRYELFVVPIDGSAPAQKVATDPVFSIPGFTLDPTSTRAIYWFRGLSLSGWYNSISSVSLVPGSTPVLLTSHAFGDIETALQIVDMNVSPDGRWLTYVLQYDDSVHFRSECYLVHADRPGATELSFDYFPHVSSPAEFSGDSQHLVFTKADAGSTPTHVELHGSSVTGDDHLLSHLGSGRLPPARIGPDGTVFFGTNGLSRVPADGSAAPQVLVPAAPNGQSRLIEISPAGDWVAFARLDTVTFVTKIFGVQSAGGPVVTLAEVAHTGITELRFALDSRTLVYRTGLELFAVPSDGHRHARRLNGPLPAGGTVSSVPFVVSDDTVVYLADENRRGVFELFESRIADEARPVSK